MARKICTAGQSRKESSNEGCCGARCTLHSSRLGFRESFSSLQPALAAVPAAHGDARLQWHSGAPTLDASAESVIFDPHSTLQSRNPRCGVVHRAHQPLQAVNVNKGNASQKNKCEDSYFGNESEVYGLRSSHAVALKLA